MSQSDFVTRGQALVSAGQFQEAVKVCRLGLLGRPTTVEGRVVLGQALLALKRYDEVLAEMRVALELDHTSTPAQVLKGEALLRKGDGHAAADVLGKVRAQGLGDAQVTALLADAERLVGRSPGGGADEFDGGPEDFGADQGTKNYPSHADGGLSIEELMIGEYTRPTSVAAQGSRERTTLVDASLVEQTPAPAMLPLDKRSGTVEVDPDLDVIESRGEDDFGDLVGPPPARATATPAGLPREGPRIAVQPSTRAPKSLATAAAVAAKKARRTPAVKDETATVELDDEEMLELDDTRSPEPRTRPGPDTQSRTAQKPPAASSDPPPAPSPDDASGPSHLAQRIANQPHIMNVMPSVQVRLAPQLQANPRGGVGSTLPTVAEPALPEPSRSERAQDMPPMQLPPDPPAQDPTYPPHAQSSQQEPYPPQHGPSPQDSYPPQHAASPQDAYPPQHNPSSQAPQHARPQHDSYPPQDPAYPQHGSSPPPDPMYPHAQQGYPQAPSQPPSYPPQDPGYAAQPQSMQQPQLQQTLQGMPPAPMHLPPTQLPPHLQSSVAAAHPTMALQSSSPPSASELDAMLHGINGQGPSWGGAPPGAPGYNPGKAGAEEQTRQGHELDPQIAAMLGSASDSPSTAPPAAVFVSPRSGSTQRSVRSGVRKSRSRLQVVVWIVIGALVIGGGVFAGFQIRAIRLHRQIAAARDRAVDVAKADTWQGWLGARDSLYSIAQASPTVDNKAALAHARGVLAFEMGDGLAEAKAAVEALAGQSTVDLDIARAYVALALSDPKAAREAADHAVQAAPSNAAALYVAGQAALAAGDVKGAIATLRSAVEREARPLYTVGLARALAASAAWDEALATAERVRDNPAAIIARGVLLASAGRVTGAPATQLRAQLVKLIVDGQKPGEQDHASPAQVAFAGLALAQVDFARNELGAARGAYVASLEAKLDDQPFAEEFVETGYAIGELETARKAALRVLEKWSASRRARTALAQILLVGGKPIAALELFTRAPDAAASPRGQTIRGQVRLAVGDVDGARADFDAALKKLPGYEPALIARTWLDLANGDVVEARKRIDPRVAKPNPTIAMATVHAAVVRAGGDTAGAKKMLERIVGGAPSLDAARAQLELARIHRELGDARAARAAYAEASRSGSVDMRLESAVFLFETGEPKSGRDTLEQLLKEAAPDPSGALLLEAARARSLLGDHPGAAALLGRADKTPGVIAWQLARERGRLALRRGDTPSAAQDLERALAGCGADLDTFILAADTVATDERQQSLAQKLKAVLPARLKGRPELDIVNGKLQLAAGRQDEAERSYDLARNALVKDKASQRRRAQADYGLAAIAYFKRDDPTAQNNLALVMIEDPTIYAAYLFAAEIAKPKEPKKALELAQQATTLNPDSIDGWKLVGTLAAQLGDRKLLSTAIARVGELDPGSETHKLLQDLR